MASPDKYRWSSYAANALGKQDSLLSPHGLYIGLGSTEAARQSGYQALFNKVLSDKELDEIRESTNKGWALGDHKFRDRIETLAQRRSEPLSKGRPKKVDDGNRV